jgi:uncharacterized protein (TIGR02678 family)
VSASGIDDRQRAARALLMRPLVRSASGDDFRLVKKYAPDLRDWFDTNTGWTLHLDSEVARLAKEPATVDNPTHPIRATNDQAFSRRRYVLLMLCLASLERSDAQISLGRLADQVVLYGGTSELTQSGFTFGLTTRDDRSDLVAVVQTLLGWGVLSRVAGDEQEFVHSTGDVLYDVSRRVLSQLLVSRRGPSMVDGATLAERLEAMRDRGMPPSDDLRNLRLRHTLTRRLLDDPVVYFNELSADEGAYLRSQRSAICRRITELTGLVPEIRAEGLAMVDLDDDLTDLRMPDRGTEGHVTLLIAEHIAGSQQTEHSLDDLADYIRSVRAEYAPFWRAGSQEPGAEVALVATAASRLVALHVCERIPDGVRALAALARFAVDAPTITGAPRP